MATGENVPWALTSDQHPWPLRYHPLATVFSLYLDLPSPADTKLELPGLAADQAERTRVAVNQYFSNLLGSDNRTRGGQLDALSTWLDRIGQQESAVGADPWAHYEFSREALDQMTQFRAGVAGQTEPQSRQVLSEVRNAVARITPLVQLMPTYETRLAWYNVLVQLKEGLAEYQAQASETDQKLLTAIDSFLATHPQVPRPEGDAPPRPQGFARHSATPTPATQAQAQTATAMNTLQDSHTPAAMPPEKKQSSSVLGSLLIAFFAVGTLGWVVMKVRGRNKGGLKLPAVASKKTP